MEIFERYRSGRPSVGPFGSVAQGIDALGSANRQLKENVAQQWNHAQRVVGDAIKNR